MLTNQTKTEALAWRHGTPRIFAADNDMLARDFGNMARFRTRAEGSEGYADLT